MDAGAETQKRGRISSIELNFYKEYYIPIVENLVESVENPVETG